MMRSCPFMRIRIRVSRFVCVCVCIKKVDERKMCVMKNVNNADENRPTDSLHSVLEFIYEDTRERKERDFQRKIYEEVRNKEERGWCVWNCINTRKVMSGENFLIEWRALAKFFFRSL